MFPDSSIAPPATVAPTLNIAESNLNMKLNILENMFELLSSPPEELELDEPPLDVLLELEDDPEELPDEEELEELEDELLEEHPSSV